MKPILNEQEGRLLNLKRQLARLRTRSPEARARLIKQIKELEKNMGLRATEEPRVQVGSPQSPARYTMNFIVDNFKQKDILQILSTIPCIAFERVEQEGGGHYIVHQNCLLNTWGREFESELPCQGDPRNCLWHQLKSIQPELPGFQQGAGAR